MRIYLDSSRVERGRFLLWTWELWSIGGGSGVAWFFFDHSFYPGRYNPLWAWFYFQRWYRGRHDTN